MIFTLGPLGLNHHAGVQFWNLFFVIAVPAIFVERDNPSDTKSTGPKRQREWTFAASVFLIPLSGLFGIADNWPSWQVYSPRPEVVRVFVRNSAVDTLPEPMKQFLGRTAPLQDWTPLRIDAWSLNTVNAPIYPQERFGIAVGWFVAEHIEENDIKVNIERPQLAFWKSHEWSDIEGRNELEKFAPMRRRRQ